MNGSLASPPSPCVLNNTTADCVSSKTPECNEISSCLSRSELGAGVNIAVPECVLPSVDDAGAPKSLQRSSHQLTVCIEEVSADSNCSTCKSVPAPATSNNDANWSIDADVNSNSSSFCHELTDTTTKESAMSMEMLRDELARVKEQLHFKEEQCIKLTKMQDQTGIELQDLTASLFEEANKMVQDAHIQRMATEKKLVEANAKIEILQAEVTALKSLVITSTPSAPNRHLNPQIDRAKKVEFTKGHRRSTSHHNFSSLGDKTGSGHGSAESLTSNCDKSHHQVEPLYMDLFLRWKREPVINAENSFLACIVTEDILPCIRFANEPLSKLVFEGVFSNTLTVEPLPNCSNLSHTHCSLTEMMRPCQYSVKLDASQASFSISQMARNRIIAVCDLLTYLRYIAQGLVKCDELGMYTEISRLRKNICLARLGLTE